MKMVAAARLRRAQDQILAARPYAYHLRDVIRHVAGLTETPHPLLEPRPIKGVCLIVVTADRGLCAGFNTNIARKATEVFRGLDGLDRRLLAVGRKGRDHFRRREVPLEAEYTQLFRALRFSHAQDIVSTVLRLYHARAVDRVVVVYNEFKSAIRQQVVVEDLLPLSPRVLAEEPPPGGAMRARVDYLYEPAPPALLDSLIPRQLNIQMWRMLLESNAAEQAARMTAMDAATDNAGEIIQNLTQLFNRTRQQTITKELSEIVGTAEALK